MANFFFFRYHFVQVDEPDLFSEVEEGVTDFDERHNPRFAEGVAINADGIGKLNLFNFKVDKKTGEQTSVQYENYILHYPCTFVIVDMRPGNQAILVQQKSSAFKNPDEVAALVTDYCSRVLQLSSLGLKMRLDKRLCKGSIWDVVSMRTDREQDRVKSFTFLINKKRLKLNNGNILNRKRIYNSFIVQIIAIFAI